MSFIVRVSLRLLKYTAALLLSLFLLATAAFLALNTRRLVLYLPIIGMDPCREELTEDARAAVLRGKLRTACRDISVEVFKRIRPDPAWVVERERSTPSCMFKSGFSGTHAPAVFFHGTLSFLMSYHNDLLIHAEIIRAGLPALTEEEKYALNALKPDFEKLRELWHTVAAAQRKLESEVSECTRRRNRDWEKTFVPYEELADSLCFVFRCEQILEALLGEPRPFPERSGGRPSSSGEGVTFEQ